MKKKKLKHWQFNPDRMVGFGKHFGKRWREVPTEYLKWFAENAYGQMVNRQAWALEELKRRELEQDKNVCLSILTTDK